MIGSLTNQLFCTKYPWEIGLRIIMGTEKFCLRWNDFERNISSAFKQIKDSKDFFDVTLACDDDQINAHKVIIAACSPLFQNILKHAKLF